MLDVVLCYRVFVPCRSDPCCSGGDTTLGLCEYMVDCPFGGRTDSIQRHQQFVMQQNLALERCLGCGLPECMDDPLQPRW
jgi:hypothetical protein